MRNRCGEHDLRRSIAKALDLSDESIQFLCRRECDLNQHGIHACDAVALQYVGTAADKRIELRFLVSGKLQVDKSGDVISQLLAVDYRIVSQNDSLLFQLKS